jgi:hypothetical protein
MHPDFYPDQPHDYHHDYRTHFSDEEIIEALKSTPQNDRYGNLWTFYNSLPKPERERLAEEAEDTI